MYKTAILILSLLAMMACNKQITDKRTHKRTHKVKEFPKVKKIANISNNPLLMNWKTPHNVPPFDKFKNEDFLPALEYAIIEHSAEVTSITKNKDVPSFKNTIEALEKAGSTLTKVSNVFFALTAAHTNDELDKTKNIIAPKLASHRDDINLNKELFERVKAVYDKKDALDLIPEQKRLLEVTYKNFIRAGVNTKGEDEKKLRDINVKLASLTQKYGDNLLKETNSFELHLTDKKDLENLSPSLIANAAKEALKRGHKKGWSFTLQRPSINPFLQSSPNRELREKLFQGYRMRGDNDNEYDNKAVLTEIASLRYQKAKLLGFETYADYSLSNTMAKTPAAVYSLMDKIWKPALEMTKKDRESLAQMMKEDGVEGKFRGSDWRYYVEKIRKSRYNFDEEETRPYFEFTAVRDGAFQLAERLFGLKIYEKKDLPKWHEDQQVFEVVEANGKHIGILYMDFFTRKSKRGGAWMNELRNQSEGINPIVTNNFNFPPPTKEGPSLLSFGEAQTLFHEFGHALHGLLSNVKYGFLSGTNVPRDFVEFPSQVMENWMSQPEVLKGYAKHYKTGEVIPDEMIKRMNDANNFNIGFGTLEYMAAAYLDMNWHTLKTAEIQDARAFEKQAMDKLGMIDEIVPRYRSQYFSHIFSGGYAAGYYSYLWSEVLDADIFDEFIKSGDIFNKELSDKYRRMLGYGGSKTGMELYKSLIGREPKIDALLKKKGF